MKWHVLGSYGGSSPQCRTTSFLIDDTLALDAGAITQALSLEAQRAINHIVLTHSHLDHIASIPFLIENTFGQREGAVEILVSPPLLHTIKHHLFNNDTWPDFTRIPNDLLPAMRLRCVEERLPFAVNHLRLTPVPVNHTVPTHAFLVEDDRGAALFTSDTGPTDEVWEVANRTEHLHAVIVEVSFPNRMQGVADLALHLTPQTLAAELVKLRRRVPVYLYHLKPPFLEELRRELAETGFPHPVEELVQDRVYHF